MVFKTYAADRITEIAHEVHAVHCAVWRCPVDKVYRLNLPRTADEQSESTSDTGNRTAG